MAGMEDIVGKTGNYNVRDKFKRFDNKFIRPLVLKHIQVCIRYSAKARFTQNIEKQNDFSCLIYCNFHDFFLSFE